MSITSEIREYIWQHATNNDELRAIADRIDAEHRKAEDEWKAKNGDMWLKGYNACHEELMEGHPVIVADLEKAGWVRLPVDADGVPWYRGSRVIDPKDPDGKVNTVWIAGDNTLITDDHLFIFSANELRHYREPTVEDVLREFAEKMNENISMYTGEVIDADEWRDADARTVEKYAAKLQLKEGA